MRLLAVVLLVCLLVAGTVSAITVFPGAVATTKAIKQVTVAVLQTTTPTPSPIGVADYRGELLVYSVPSGAAITLDGSSTGDVTSKDYRLPPGSHTVVLSLSGYQDYSETFTISSHETWRINAPLKQKLPASAAAVSLKPVPVSGMMTLVTGPSPGAAFVPGVMFNMPNTTDYDICTKIPDLHPANNVDWKWQCMLLSDAYQNLNHPFYYLETLPACGYVTVDYQTVVTKVCCAGEPKASLQFTTMNATVPIAPGSGVKIVTNKTRLSLPNQMPVPVPQGALVVRHQDAVSSFFGFFSSLFGKNTCPFGQTSCDGSCADLTTDQQNCGKCGMTCNANASCCNGMCVNLKNDADNCGTCGMSCFAPAICCYGSCEYTCDDNAMNSHPEAPLL